MIQAINNKSKRILNKQYNSQKVVAVWFVSLVFIAIGVVTTPYLSFISLVLFGVSLLFFKSEDTLTLLFGLLPFANIFKLSTTSMSLFTVCEIALVIFFLFRKNIKLSQLCMLLALVVFFIFTSLDDLSFLTILKVIVGFLLIRYAITTFTKEGLKNSARLLSLSTILMLLLSCNNTYLGYVEEYFNDLDYLVSTGNVTATLRISGFFGDPNYCAVLIVLVLSLLCVLYYYKAINVEFWVHTAFLVPLGFLTYSKSYLLCIALFLGLFILFVLFPKHKVLAFATIAGIIAVLYFVLNGKIEVINIILNRFKDGNLTTGRMELNIAYLQYIFDNAKVLFFGEGLSADRFIGATNNVHCLYIEVLYKLGIFGTALYVGTLITTVSRQKTKTERHFVNYLPLILFLLLFGFLAGVLNYALPFYIIIVYLTFNYTKLDSRIVKEEEL